MFIICHSNIIEWSSSNEAVATVENGTVTAVSGGEATITAKLFGQEYKTEVDVVTKYIANTADFTNLVTTEDLNGYYVLTENIALTGTFAGLTSGTFSGIFDGRGHTISGGKFTVGLLGAKATNVTVRNLAIVDSVVQTASGGQGGGVAKEITGNSMIKNVFIKLNKNNDAYSTYAPISYMVTGTLTAENVVTYLADKWGNASSFAFWTTNLETVINGTNCHAGSGVGLANVATNTGTCTGVTNYASLAEMQAAAANGAIDLSSFKGFSEYSAMRKFLNVFKAYDLGKLPNAMYLDSAEAYTFTAAQTLEADDIASLQIGAATVTDYTFANGTFTIPASNYAKIVGGENVDVVISTLSGDTYAAKLDVITKVLRSASDFTTASTDLSGYFVLGNDITDLAAFAGLTSGTFSGVFDGRGYMIKGCKFSTGLLGVKANNVTVRNLALVDCIAQSAHAGQGGGLTREITGESVLENVFIKLNKNNDAYSTYAPISYMVTGTLTTTNVVTYLADKWGNASSFAFWTTNLETVINGTNCYSGSNVS